MMELHGVIVITRVEKAVARRDIRVFKVDLN